MLKQRIIDSAVVNPHRWAGTALLLSVSVLAIPAYLWIDAERAQVGSVGRSIDKQGAETRVWMRDNLIPPMNRLTDSAVGIPATVAVEFRRQADQLQKNLFAQIDAARIQILAPDGRLVDLQTAVLHRVDDSLSIVKDLRREDVAPLLASARGTLAEISTAAKTYGDLPAQVGAQIQPSWLAIEPEVTCRKPDGAGGFVGYGGCWHSRITGLMGEAVNVGGVFTQQFPSLAKSFTGIASDAHGWTSKYVQPHPMTTKDKFAAAGKIVIGLGMAGLRGGVF